MVQSVSDIFIVAFSNQVLPITCTVQALVMMQVMVSFSRDGTPGVRVDSAYRLQAPGIWISLAASVLASATATNT